MNKVLVADDEPAILEGFRHIIDWDEHGLELVGFATDGQSALEQAVSRPVDILLTDVRMPKMDGLELVRQINKRHLRIKTIILSGYDDFQYVKEAIRLGVEDYLLKPVNREELSATLLNASEKVDIDRQKRYSMDKGLSEFSQNILCRWAVGSIGQEELAEKAAVAGLHLNFRWYMAAVFHLWPERTPESAQKNDREAVLRFSILNICTELASPALPYMVFGDLKENVVLLFYGDDLDARRNEILATLKALQREIDERLNQRPTVFAGSLAHGPDGVPGSYCGACARMPCALAAQGKTFFDAVPAELLRETMRNHGYDPALLAGMLEAGKEKDALVFVKNALEAAGGEDEAKDAFSELLAVILQAGRITEKNTPYNISIRNLCAEVLDAAAPNTRYHLLCVLIGKVVASLVSESGNLNPIIHRILEYISENYSGEISVKILSDQFHINAAYLGQLFKNETGELLTNYVNNIRIKKAKELLISTSLKAAEISKLVGYVNPNYFYRTFKKIAGTSPSEFKRE